MRATLAYTSARIGLLVAAGVLLYLAGARGLLLLALAFVVSGIASFVLLSRQRDVMSGALMARIRNRRHRLAEFRARIEEGARAEDHDDRAEDGARAEDGDRPRTTTESRLQRPHRRARPRQRAAPGRLARLAGPGGQPAAGGQQPQHGTDRLVAGHGGGVQHQVGVPRLLVGIGNPGEAGDQPRPRLGVH